MTSCGKTRIQTLHCRASTQGMPIKSHDIQLTRLFHSSPPYIEKYPFLPQNIMFPTHVDIWKHIFKSQNKTQNKKKKLSKFQLGSVSNRSKLKFKAKTQFHLYIKCSLSKLFQGSKNQRGKININFILSWHPLQH